MVWVGTSLPTRGVVFQWASTILKDCPKAGLAPDGSSTYTPKPTCTNLFIDQAIELGKPCSSRYETEKLSKRL